jgi:hypothetical protein
VTIPPAHQPPGFELERLFDDPKMFASGHAWRQAGFEILRARDDEIMVGRHPSCPQYVFKRFPDEARLYLIELTRYKRRVEGACALREFIEAQGFQHVTVPQKWVVQLPPQFKAGRDLGHVLVADYVHFHPKDESARRYLDIDDDTLTELASIWFNLKELDFFAFNAPFTIDDDKIAFIDTERIAPSDHDLEHRVKAYMRSARRVLSDKRLRHAERLLAGLIARYAERVTYCEGVCPGSPGFPDTP